MSKIAAKVRVVPVFDQHEAAQKINQSLPSMFDEIKGGNVYIQQEIVGDECTPLFCEIFVVDKDLCSSCDFSDRDLMEFGSGGYDMCYCKKNRILNITYRIVSVLNYRPSSSKPQDSVYDVRIHTINVAADGFDFQTCLEQAICAAQFSVRDSIDEYTGNPAKEMVVRFISDNAYRIPASNFNHKHAQVYKEVYDYIIHKIFNQPVVPVVSENPHVERRKKGKK